MDQLQAWLEQLISPLKPAAADDETSAADVGPIIYRSADDLQWDHLQLRTLPVLMDADPGDEESLRRPRSVSGACFSRAKPTPLERPSLLAVAPDALALVELLPEELERQIAYFCGNALPPGSEPLAHCYAGHQFGVYAGQLGDGAAISLGEVVNGRGERWEVQLKGAGRTHYSRAGTDGRKVLRSSLREFLCSEAMHHLGIPTTRAAALVTSDSRVMRDVLRNGNAKEEHCAVVARVARSFLRFGSFEVCRAAGADGDRAGPSAGLEREMLVPLVDYAVEVLFPALGAAHASTEARCAALLAEAVARTARLVAAWQAVGFVHGVLNTDNMALTGDTIDYGPFGFLNCYDEDCTPNTSDAVRAPPPAPRPASSLVPDRSSPDAPPSLSRAVRCAATRTPTSRARATSTCSGSPRRWRRCCPRRRRRAISTPSGRRLRRSGTTAGFKGRRPCRRAAPHLPPQDHRKAQAAPTQPERHLSSWEARRASGARLRPFPQGGLLSAATTRHERFMAKLGLRVAREDGDAELLESLLRLMQATSADYTNTFRALTRIELPAAEEACYMSPQAISA